MNVSAGSWTPSDGQPTAAPGSDVNSGEIKPNMTEKEEAAAIVAKAQADAQARKAVSFFCFLLIFQNVLSLPRSLSF